MSVKVYTSPSCASCRKAKRWLNDFGIDYVEKNIFVSKLNREELKTILSKTEHGFEDIISTRSKVFKEQSVDINDMSINELLDFIEENPSVLKRPIIIDDRRLQIGYNDEEIRVFIPRELREHYQCEGCGYDRADGSDQCSNEEQCPNYEAI
ncbi:Spx/MgsR family RNA polymerase-binding regulatory protein [Erysipelotrichaceae bacterium OttesenSCG-928-M19]|nr:Spx/MgsR family RNA polymerase-binding regulatory protein [Erysipelotrichaceae bacterium OttesenSCG-928-M19]